MSSSHFSVAVVGGSGYTGQELLRLLALHPQVEVVAVCSRTDSGREVADRLPALRGLYSLKFSEIDVQLLSTADLVFFATPNGVAMKLAPTLVDNNVRVVDLSADFRIDDVAVWQQWYGMNHYCPNLLQQSVYGLPELDSKNNIATAALVANPGCYATAMQLSIAPLMQLRDKLDLHNVVVDGKSGVSGAGRSLVETSLFSQASENVSAYKIQGHRHLPEVVQQLHKVVADTKLNVTFVPHLIPMIRGILSTTYVHCSDVDFDFYRHFCNFYSGKRFIDVVNQPMETKAVSGTNICRLGCYFQGNTLVVIATIDNLVKGAAGQAIQNMNLMLGIDESCGLNLVAQYP